MRTKLVHLSTLSMGIPGIRVPNTFLPFEAATAACGSVAPGVRTAGPLDQAFHQGDEDSCRRPHR